MATRLEHVIARNMTRLRDGRGWTQANLAQRMSAAGIRWTSNRVTQVETLRRPLSLLEVAALGWIFGVPVGELLAGDDVVQLPGAGRTAPLSGIRASFTGAAGEIPEGPAGTFDGGLSPRDDLYKLAAMHGFTPEGLDRLAVEVYGRSYINERNARTADTTGMSKRSAQSKRGHASRAILAELAEHRTQTASRAS